MKIKDFLGRDNTVPDTDFEKGRQEVLDELEKKIKKRRDFLFSAIDKKEKLIITPEMCEDIVKYNEILGDIVMLRSKNAETKYYAGT